VNLPKDLSEFIALLNSHGVEYLVVGGHAVAFHGYARYTGDLDFFVRRSDANASRLVAVLKKFGFPDAEGLRETLTLPDKIVQLGRPPQRIDLLTSVSGLEFDEAWAACIAADLGGNTVHFPDRASLIANRRASGRREGSRGRLRAGTSRRDVRPRSPGIAETATS
jgi:hypothetical protein